MTTDYESLRSANRERYGWDTAHIELLGSLYTERTHFIFELIQNAEDANARTLAFDLRDDRLEVRHDGKPFTEDDVTSLCQLAHSSKSGDLTKIGKFGIGFKSVYAYTRSPHVYSGDESFRIEKYVQPHAVPARDGLVDDTLFSFPFDRDDVPAERAAAEIAQALAKLSPEVLLFLKKIEQLKINLPRVPAIVLDRIEDAGPTRSSRQILISDSRVADSPDAEWLVWRRAVGDDDHSGQQVEIAFQYKSPATQQHARYELARLSRSPLVAFFPTAKETGLGFLIQGSYRTTPSRDNVPEHDDWNRKLVTATAGLLTEVLDELRDDGLLTVDVLQMLPIDSDRFPEDGMFRPLFEAVLACIRNRHFIPLYGGGFGRAGETRLARGTRLRELLAPDILGSLYGAETHLSFAHESITADRAPDLWYYLRDQESVEEVTPEGVLLRTTREFLTAQPDEWITRFYEFLLDNPALSRAARYGGERPGIARTKPVIRLEDGSHVVPFRDNGQPAAYLPGTIETEFPTVRRAIAAVPKAREFLTSIGLSVPDVVAEVFEVVIPRYHGMNFSELDLATHESDLHRIVQAAATADSSRRQRLLFQLRETSFLIGENAATSDKRLLPPPYLYLHSDELQIYLDGNQSAWFIDGRYQPWLDLLLELGLRTKPEIYARPPSYSGYVTITEEWGLHERGIDRFDPDAKISDFDFALKHPSPERSEYIWNAILSPNRHLISGTVEISARKTFIGSRTDERVSPIGLVAASHAWIPDGAGNFHRPADIQFEDLPEGYQRDETLATALGIAQPIVAEASRQLGVPADLLRALSKDPDLVTEVLERLKERSASASADMPAGDASEPPAAAVDYAAELSDTFGRSPKPTPETADSGVEATDGTISNPELRRQRVQESILDDRAAEPPASDRTREVTRRVWEGKDDSVRQFLLEQYSGRCQICRAGFRRLDGIPYFEGVYLVSQTKGRWISRPGNVLCLCATCCAKFQHGSLVAPDITEQIRSWRTAEEGGSHPALAIELCGESVEIRFSEKHLLDLQEVLLSSDPPTQGSMG
jgi:hypothetical protein